MRGARLPDHRRIGDCQVVTAGKGPADPVRMGAAAHESGSDEETRKRPQIRHSQVLP